VTAALSIRGLGKDYGALRAVDALDLDVPAGEIFGLLGPNGAGKTTAISMVAGVLTPSRGTASVAGHDIESQSFAARGALGLVPQDLAIYEDLTARQNLHFFGSLYGLSGSLLRERIDWALDVARLADRARERVSGFSGGMKRRLNLVAGLLHKPALLILDEPTVGLDPNQVIDIRNMIRELRGHSTILLSTHILHEVSVVCDRVIIIDHGNIIAEDTAEALNRRVQGVFHTLVRVEGPAAEVVAALRAIAGVEQVNEDRVPSDSTTRLKVVSKEGEAARKAIVRTIVDRGWSLVEVSPITLTLEDLFVRLVRHEQRGH